MIKSFYEKLLSKLDKQVVTDKPFGGSKIGKETGSKSIIEFVL